MHGDTRADAVCRLQAALAATHVSGIETNLDLLRSFAGTDEFGRAEITTDVLEQHQPALATIEVVAAGASTTVQDLPGRLGYWHVGVPAERTDGRSVVRARQSSRSATTRARRASSAPRTGRRCASTPTR